MHGSDSTLIVTAMLTRCPQIQRLATALTLPFFSPSSVTGHLRRGLPGDSGLASPPRLLSQMVSRAAVPSSPDWDQSTELEEGSPTRPASSSIGSLSAGQHGSPQSLTTGHHQGKQCKKLWGKLQWPFWPKSASWHHHGHNSLGPTDHPCSIWERPYTDGNNQEVRHLMEYLHPIPYKTIWLWVPAPLLIPSAFYMNALRGSRDGSSSQVSDTHMGNLEWVSSSC